MGKNWLDTASLADIAEDLLGRYGQAEEALVCENATHANLDKDLAELKTECAEYRTRIELLKTEVERIASLAKIGEAVLEMGKHGRVQLRVWQQTDLCAWWEVRISSNAAFAANTLKAALAKAGLMEEIDG